MSIESTLLLILMVYWVYMLLVGPISRGYNRKIYTGYTKHLASRLTQHSGISNIRGARLTRKQQIELVYLEKFVTQKEAMKREWEFKHSSPLNQKKNKLVLKPKVLELRWYPSNRSCFNKIGPKVKPQQMPPLMVRKAEWRH